MNLVFANDLEWQLDDSSRHLLEGTNLLDDIKIALDAAKDSGTNPSISGYDVKSATLLHTDKGDRVFISGNTEYEVPEALHSESNLLAQITSTLGIKQTKQVKFIAFNSNACSKCAGCGDCRDYIKAQTDYKNLLIVCGDNSNKTIYVNKFIDGLLSEDEFSDLNKKNMPITQDELTLLYKAAKSAKEGGINFFTGNNHSAAAALSFSGKIYKASGADDSAFHYRPPISGVLQQAATEKDYLLKAVLVIGDKEQWPVVSYKDRQYGYEYSLFNKRLCKAPIALILANNKEEFKISTFEKALPFAFSLEWLIPEKLDAFVEKIKTL